MRPGAPWCTLCLAPVQGAPRPRGSEPLPEPLPQPSLGPGVDPLTAPLHVLLGEPAPVPARPAARPDPAWPCSTCGRLNDLDASVCAGCGDGFLSVVAAAEAASLRLPVVGDLRSLTPGQRRMVNVAVILLVLVLLLVLAGLGAVLG